MTDKQLLRQEMRLLRPERAVIAAASQRICRHVLASDVFSGAKVVAGYLPLWWEADVTPILLEALKAGKTLALPRIGPSPVMDMRMVRSLDDLVPGPMNLLEPAEDAQIVPPEEIDLVLVPLEALSRSGVRLGKGGGYYDCFLQKMKAVTLGMVLPWQWREEIPQALWDRPLDAAAHSDGIDWFNQ